MFLISQGHTDGVSVMSRHPSKLNQLWSGAQDGQIRAWNLTKKKSTKKIQAHDGWVRGLSISKSNKGLVFKSFFQNYSFKFIKISYKKFI